MSATQTVESQITLVPGNLIVGTNLAAEYIRVKDTIAGTGSGTVSLALKPVARFSEVPAVWGMPQTTRAITSWYISAQSETEITVTINVGTGSAGDTITLAAVMIGPQAWK